PRRRGTPRGAVPRRVHGPRPGPGPGGRRRTGLGRRGGPALCRLAAGAGVLAARVAGGRALAGTAAGRGPPLSPGRRGLLAPGTGGARSLVRHRPPPAGRGVLEAVGPDTCPGPGSGPGRSRTVRHSECPIFLK